MSEIKSITITTSPTLGSDTLAKITKPAETAVLAAPEATTPPADPVPAKPVGREFYYAMPNIGYTAFRSSLYDLANWARSSASQRNEAEFLTALDRKLSSLLVFNLRPLFVNPGQSEFMPLQTDPVPNPTEKTSETA